MTRFLPERYRSGHNGGASKASCLPKAGPWVRIPPSPPAYSFWCQLVSAVRFFVYLQCLLRLGSGTSPGPPYVRLQLFLPVAHPRGVMLLSDLDAAVTEQHR